MTELALFTFDTKAEPEWDFFFFFFSLAVKVNLNIINFSPLYSYFQCFDFHLAQRDKPRPRCVSIIGTAQEVKHNEEKFILKW